jgi:hypothetical protein
MFRCVAPHASAALPAARACVLGLAVLGAGCASKHAAHEPPARIAGPHPHAVQGAWRIEIEEDGLPAQLAPRHRRPEPDDPSEPWSPNYGSRAPQKPAAAPPVTLPAPAERSAARVTALDPDEIIRRAIAEHEMRRRD